MDQGLKGSALLAGSKLPARLVEVPAWSCTVEVRGFTARQRADFITRGNELKGDRPEQLRQIQPWVVQQTVYDPQTGERIFTPDDHAALLEQDARILDQLSGVAMDLSGLGKGAEEEAGKD